MQTVLIQICQLLQNFAEEDQHCLSFRLYTMLHDSVDFDLLKIANGGNFYMPFL